MRLKSLMVASPPSSEEGKWTAFGVGSGDGGGLPASEDAALELVLDGMEIVEICGVEGAEAAR